VELVLGPALELELEQESEPALELAPVLVSELALERELELASEQELESALELALDLMSLEMELALDQAWLDLELAASLYKLVLNRFDLVLCQLHHSDVAVCLFSHAENNQTVCFHLCLSTCLLLFSVPRLQLQHCILIPYE